MRHVRHASHVYAKQRHGDLTKINDFVFCCCCCNFLLYSKIWKVLKIECTAMYCLAVFSLTETWTQKSHLDLDFLTFYTMFNSVNTTLMEFQFESNARMIRPLTLPPCAYIIAYFLHSLVSLLIHVFAFHRVCYSSCRCVFTNLFEWKVLLYVYFLKR